MESVDSGLVSQDGSERLFSRPYQSQLEEIAIRKNTIIHLPTGSGKTYIAMRLIKRFRQALQKPWGEGGKRTFFLVNTVPLVNQQKKSIEEYCPVKGVGGYSGEDGVDYWQKSKWDAELTKNQVVVMTSQILCDMITHGYIRIDDINLLIFDECHHAVDDHPMRRIMKHFDSCPAIQQPRILGLTATLLNANVNIHKVQDNLRELETTFHATIATVNELGEVLTYSTNPHELVLYFSPSTPTDVTNIVVYLLQKLQHIVLSVVLPKARGNPEVAMERGQQDITTDPKKIVKAVKNMIEGMINGINELGAYGGQLTILAYIILLERLKRKCSTKEEAMLYQIAINHSTEARMKLLESMENDKGFEKIKRHSSSKFLQLLNVLKEYGPLYYEKPGVLTKVNKARKPLSGIIFAQQRFTAKVLYNLLKDVIETNPEEFGFLKHDFIVGFNINPFKSTREQHYLKKCSQKALLKFSSKELNCLISTSVIEEGVDISQCSLVVRFDPPLEYRSYIQSKGRARSSESSFVLLVSESNRSKFLSQYYTFQKTEQYIQRMLIGNTDDRAAPTEEDIREGLYEDEEVPPYVTEFGNRLSAASAISLLNRYCSTLPHDQFTIITPIWIEEKDHRNDKRTITIIMPIACPIKEKIKGLPFIQQKSAKRSAALNTCIKLHQEGELDYATLLPRRYGKVDFEDPDVKQCFLNWPWDEVEDNGEENEFAPKPGSKKMVRKHKKVFPKCLKSSKNWRMGQRTFYLHIIKMKTVFDEPKESRERALYNLLQRGEGYGLLTTAALPKLCDFPMFLTVGEVATSLEVNYAVVPLDLTLFELIKQFHFFVFEQVLDVAKKFLVYDGEDNNMFVVPIKEDNGYDIDWDVITNFEPIQPVEVPSYEERKKLHVTRESYQNAVVTPWYRGCILPDRYIVSDVLEYMTPQSRFDSNSNSYETYEDYYSSKYNLEIFGRKDQPVLEVRNISSRMNCLMPRAATIKAFTDKQQKMISAAQGDDKPKTFMENFIPEFCIKYEYPGVLWYKAIMLPSIVHRVFNLLVAHELREEITKATKYGKCHLDLGEEWLPIKVDIHIATKALLSLVEEPGPVNSIDRINNPVDETLTRRPLNIMSMKETIYQLQKKRISKEYPWDEVIEPTDIERHLSTVTVMDIECYDEFVSARLDVEELNEVRSPPRPTTSAAILPPPAKFNDKIKLLSRTPTGRGPELRDILSALTTIKSRDIFNLERAETLGDSFLKFAASLYLYHKFPKLNEGQLTNIKGRLIGNRNLYYAGNNVSLGGRMKIEVFSPRKDFMVPGFFAPAEAKEFIESKNLRPTFLIGMAFPKEEAMQGELSAESKELILNRFLDSNGVAEEEPRGGAQNVMQTYVKAQALADKSVADSVEALIGTYLLSGGVLAAVKVLEWFKVLPPQDNFALFLNKTVPTIISEGKAEVKDVDFLLNDCRTDIEEIINYKFKDPSFLLEALSHASYIRNRLTISYERLEFLGDAILDFLITAHIFENSKDLKPGELTDLRSALVNNVTFASYVVKLGLHKYLCSQLNPTLDNAIMTFVKHQEQRDHEVIEDVLYLIEEEECNISEYVEVPKVLSDIFESLIGAIYLDCGGNLQTVWSIIYRIMWKEIDAFSQRIPQQPVRVLYEKTHCNPIFGKPKLIDADVSKCMVPVTVTKNGRQHTVYGVGNNKFQAKRAAAKLALKTLAL